MTQNKITLGEGVTLENLQEEIKNQEGDLRKNHPSCKKLLKKAVSGDPEAIKELYITYIQL